MIVSIKGVIASYTQSSQRQYWSRFAPLLNTLASIIIDILRCDADDLIV